MILAKTATNPLIGLTMCFRNYWRHLDFVTLQKFMRVAYDCGYVAECESDAYAIMGVLKDMKLVDIEYINNKPYKLMRLVTL
jgi:hypothetical protein